MGDDRVCLTLYAGPRRGGCYERLQRLVRALLREGWTVHYVGPEPPDAGGPSLHFHAVQRVGQGQPSIRTLVLCARKATTICVRERVHVLWSFAAAYAAILAPLVTMRGRRMVTFLRGSLVEQERAKGAGVLRRGMVASAMC